LFHFAIARGQGPGKIGWHFCQVDDVATNMIANLPVFAHNMVTSGEWKGGSICRLDSALAKPSAADVACNYHLLKPLLEFSPDLVLLMQIGRLCFCFFESSFPPALV
jgi:hypothetical protein